MKNPKVLKNIKDKEILKTIFVKNKIVNLVVKWSKKTSVYFF